MFLEQPDLTLEITLAVGFGLDSRGRPPSRKAQVSASERQSNDHPQDAVLIRNGDANVIATLNFPARILVAGAQAVFS
ncbi:hypothetical protein CVT26_010681 [Gymnopilus dilepis]|uniref:Uncharacterized protein n=1 Tax=Gymnopilus dilepis TaxID=231916 RepID=A0A409Y0Y2_9AGAR|nr:hypothetical protein CVT26_010681 [Gymnopilus dilepis]